MLKAAADTDIMLKRMKIRFFCRHENSPNEEKQKYVESSKNLKTYILINGIKTDFKMSDFF